MEKSVTWQQEGREFLELKFNLEGDNISAVTMKAIGSLSFLTLSQEMKTQLEGGSLKSINLPKGKDHATLIWREMLLKMKEEWKLPVEHVELCHCRKVDTEVVDRAVVYGAHTVEAIRRRTSANTGCATCKDDVEKLIHHRLNDQ